jgi:glycosyltransferase involved in cell wall biosynthesis
MAMEKPIVASNIGWASEMIDEGKNGFLVHPMNHDTFSKRICSFLENRELCLKTGLAARKKVKDFFDIKVLSQQNIEFYKSVIK